MKKRYLSVNQKLFFILLRPLEAFFASMSSIIDQEALSQKLFFADFVRKLMFAYLEQVSSLQSLPLELKTNWKCRELGLRYTPFSTLKDGFYRFDAKSFRQLFETVLAGVNLKSVSQLDELGLFRIIDGSLFPTLIQMGWSEYRKTKNAFKLHLEFEINRMIATEFVIGSGKSSERNFLKSVVTAGVTYIADRGYASFEIFDKLLKAEAFFVIRVKENLLYKVEEVLAVAVAELPVCFRDVRDEMVVFKSDPQQNKLRLVQFEVCQSKFCLVTTRFDLTTLEIIILYAYRWQIELFFKYLKRTLKGLHLFNHSSNGVEIQFYLLLTLALLLMKFKQDCQARARQIRKKGKEVKKGFREKEAKEETSGADWIKNIAQIFYESWKISKRWLLTVKNTMTQVIDKELLILLDTS